jgi:hypothetical protein
MGPLTLIESSVAAEQQFSCKWGIIEPSGEQKTSVEINLSLNGNVKMSLKTTDDKTLASRITSNKKSNLSLRRRSLLENFFTIQVTCFSFTNLGNLDG